jgi:hypothetical protein
MDNNSLRTSIGIAAGMGLPPSKLIAGFAGKAARDDRPTGSSAPTRVRVGARTPANDDQIARTSLTSGM